jgi:hypothetical protein
MSLSRRDFMKAFGAGVAALFLARCKSDPLPSGTAGLKHAAPVGPSCYEASAPPASDRPTPLPDSMPARARLRSYWLSFPDLAHWSAQEWQNGDGGNPSGEHLIADHRRALDQVVAAGGLAGPVADLVQEAYAAAVFHIWRSSIPATCYVTAGAIYGPESAAVLVEQARILAELPGQAAIDPQTLARARLALEHDMAYYALSEADLLDLLSSLTANGQPYPAFDELDLEPTPDTQAAARFIQVLLTTP